MAQGLWEPRVMRCRTSHGAQRQHLRIFHEYLNKGHNFKVNRSRLSLAGSLYRRAQNPLGTREIRAYLKALKGKIHWRGGAEEPDDELRMEESKKLSP